MFIVQRIDLVQHGHPVLVGQMPAILLQFVDDGGVIARHVLGRRIHQMQQNRAAFHMPQKAVAKAVALMRPGDQPRNVGNHEFGAIHLDHPQIGMKRGKGIVGNLGPRIGRGCKERGLARIGQAQQPRIGNQFQPQPDHPLNGRLAGIGPPRRLVGG